MSVSQGGPMGGSPLFAEPVSPRTKPLGRTEPAVCWFTSFTRAEAVASRQHVNAWYADFPDKAGELAARLRSEDDTKHYQALDELYVHHLLARHHMDIRYEEGPGAPDFRVYESGRCIAGVEVVSLFEPADWTRQQRQHDRLVDGVNERIRPTAGYFAIFDIESAPRDPAPRRFAEWIQRQLGDLPTPEQLACMDPATEPDMPVRVYQHNGVRIRVGFLPMSPDASSRTSPDARLASRGFAGAFVKSGSRLHGRIHDKAGQRYTMGDAPFLIAAGIHDPHCADEEILAALYRRDAVVGADQLVFRHGTTVSAIAVLRRFRPWDPRETDVAILHNFHATVAWPPSVLSCTREFSCEETSAGSRFDWKVIRQ